MIFVSMGGSMWNAQIKKRTSFRTTIIIDSWWISEYHLKLNGFIKLHGSQQILPDQFVPNVWPIRTISIMVGFCENFSYKKKMVVDFRKNTSDAHNLSQHQQASLLVKGLQEDIGGFVKIVLALISTHRLLISSMASWNISNTKWGCFSPNNRRTLIIIRWI